MQEIELKFFAPENVLEKIEAFGEFKSEKKQKDTYFIVEKNQRYLRIREEEGKFLLTLNINRTENSSEEIEFEVSPDMFLVLKGLGYEEICVVDKLRRTYEKDDLTITYDFIEGLGHFVELELLGDKHDRISELVALGEQWELGEKIDMGYPDLLIENN